MRQDMPVDPLDPPKFRHKKVPRASGSPPVPVMHSPPRPLSVKDQQDWKIPPCISNWKNPKGYTIPLDKRLAADGRGLQTTTINEGFGKLMESLVTAENSARQAVELRSQVRHDSRRGLHAVVSIRKLFCAGNAVSGQWCTYCGGEYCLCGTSE